MSSSLSTRKSHLKVVVGTEAERPVRESNGRCWLPGLGGSTLWRSAAIATGTASGAKSNAGDAKVLADLVATDCHNHCSQVPCGAH
jgi:hypothetical protein